VAADGVEKTLEGRSRRVVLTSPMRVVKLEPGRNQVETL
jgi:hypothetical protein